MKLLGRILICAVFLLCLTGVAAVGIYLVDLRADDTQSAPDSQSMARADTQTQRQTEGAAQAQLKVQREAPAQTQMQTQTQIQAQTQIQTQTQAAAPAQEQVQTQAPAQEDTSAGNSDAEQVVALVNEERAKAGLGTLTLDAAIESAADKRAKEIESQFSHTRPDGSSFSTALQESGVNFQGAGENIAWGQRSPEEVMSAWMGSEDHRANILNSSFTKIGVGYYQGESGTKYWVQLFTQ